MRSWLIVLMATLAACGESDGTSGKDSEPRGTDGSATSVVAADSSRGTTGSGNEIRAPGTSRDTPGARRHSAGHVVMIVGTSLTAGLGLEPENAYPAILQRIADSAGYRIRIVNAGLSGETSAGALRRMDWLLQGADPDIVMIETGANDGLRGLDPAATAQNLRDIVAKIKNAEPGAAMLLVPMEAPTNMGAAYTGRFRSIFPAVARETGIGLTKFLLDGIAGLPGMNQGDGIHPNIEGAKRAAQNVWPDLEGAIRRLDRAQ
jgi:acyl-CoA thioesterase I